MSIYTMAFSKSLTPSALELIFDEVSSEMGLSITRNLNLKKKDGNIIYVGEEYLFEKEDEPYFRFALGDGVLNGTALTFDSYLLKSGLFVMVGNYTKEKESAMEKFLDSLERKLEVHNIKLYRK